MRQNLFFSFFILLVSFSVFAQQDASDKKFSIEASYPISLVDGYNSNGVLDLGLKYRFADFEILKLGFGINGSLFTDKDFDNPIATNTESKDYFIQPRIFGEFSLPGMQKLKPSLGLGYSFVKSKLTGMNNGVEVSNSFNTDGLNLNIGTSYDITNSFFAQIQYDLIFLGEDNSSSSQDNFSAIKLGFGFKF